MRAEIKWKSEKFTAYIFNMPYIIQLKLSQCPKSEIIDVMKNSLLKDGESNLTKFFATAFNNWVELNALKEVILKVENQRK